MGQVQLGGQLIGWKYSTPLKADYLNTIISGLSGPGLLTRPATEVVASNNGASVTIYPFSMLVYPTDKISSDVDENGDYLHPRMAKITTETTIDLTIFQETIAIGFVYSFKDENSPTPQSAWYGEAVALTGDSISSFEGIIILTCQNYTNSSGGTVYSVSTSGADISDALLMHEGWNPRCWMSLVHPSRSKYNNISGYYNRFEIRSHNNLYNGYINGNSGTVLFEDVDDLTTIINSEDASDITGNMPYNYNTFKFQSAGFKAAESGDELPIEQTSGGIFAIVDATKQKYAAEHPDLSNPQDAFTNKLKIYPVEKEDINVYYYDDTIVIN